VYSNKTFAKRDLIPPGSGAWKGFYDAIKASANVVTVRNSQGVMGTESSVEITNFNTAPQNVLIEGLYGCTSVIAVSHRGMSLFVHSPFPISISCCAKIGITRVVFTVVRI
jgi:hypothetical protein